MSNDNINDDVDISNEIHGMMTNLTRITEENREERMNITIADIIYQYLVDNLDIIIEETIEKRVTRKQSDLIHLGKYIRIKKNDKIVGEDCIICSDEYKSGQYKRDLECKHTFHKKCIDKWFKMNKDMECPVCRKKHINDN